MPNRSIFTDACVYVDGMQTLGLATTVTPPNITYKTIEDNSLGAIATQEFNNGKIEAMEAKITFNCFYKDIFSKVAHPFRSVQLAIYGNFIEYAGDEPVDNYGSKLFLRVSPKEFALHGEMNEHENIKPEYTLRVSAARLVVKGEELYNIDISNNILVVGGIDVRGAVLANLGIV